MEISIRSVTENYRERMQRISLFDPLYELGNKRKLDRSGKRIDYFDLGFLTLLFFFENMVIRNRKVGAKELAEFLFRLNSDEVDLDYEGFEDVARTIIEVFRPSSGKRKTRKFYNWETRKYENIQYSILKGNRSDHDTKAQYYTLDEQGLELIFATKEYFNEFQLSINQLVLRKQLEKGEFTGALRQIDEMSLDVKNLKCRVEKISHEVSRNIVSDEIFQRYKKMVEDINTRLGHEDEEFRELQSFVKETRERIGNELSSEKERKTYELVLRIERELEEVHYEHRMLLDRSLELKTTALTAVYDSLYYAGIESFNFDQEIVGRIFSSPLPVSSARSLVKPLLFLEKSSVWSPLSVFFNQRIEGGARKEEQHDFYDLAEQEELDQDVKANQENFRDMARIVLESLDSEGEAELNQIVERVEHSEYKDILDNKSFYYFWIILHQRSPIELKKIDVDEEKLLGKAFELLGGVADTVHVSESEETIGWRGRFEIKNMKIKLEGYRDASL